MVRARPVRTFPVDDPALRPGEPLPLVGGPAEPSTGPAQEGPAQKDPAQKGADQKAPAPQSSAPATLPNSVSARAASEPGTGPETESGAGMSSR